MNYRKILVVNLGGIGDILLSTPALRALKARFSKTEISMLVIRRVYEVTKGLPYIDKVYILEYSAFGFLKNFFTLAALRKEHFDLLINMRTIVSQRSAREMEFLLNIINPKLRAGRDTDGMAKFFDFKIPEKLSGEKYEMDYDIEMVTALGAEVRDRSIDFKIDEKSINKIEKILQAEGVSGNTLLIGIHPGGLPAHRWPIDNFSKIIAEINKKIPSRFVIGGGKNESALAKKLIETVNLKMIDLCGELTIKELGALIKRCNLYISNDTGPMHIAAILKIPLVAIFGPGYLVRYDPSKISDKVVVLSKNTDCAPCNKVSCKSMRCLEGISPDEVAQAALSLLKKE